MDWPDGGGAAAAANLAPQRPPALFTLPELDRPPAVLNLAELEAVAGALPDKKRRLRETFERLAASSPGPLPFTWEDLDAHLSSFQYPVTLRFQQLRAAQHNQVPLPAPVSVPAAVAEKGKKRKASPSQAADADDAMRVVGEHAAAVQKTPLLGDTDGAVAEKGKKQKASSSRAAEADDAMRDVDDVAEEAEKASPLGGTDGNGTRLCPAPSGAGGGSLAVVVPQERSDAAKSRRPSNAASVVKAGGPNSTGQRRRAPRPVPAPAVASAPAIAGGGDAEKSVVKMDVEKISGSHNAEKAKVSPSPHAGGVGKTTVGGTDEDTQVDPVCNVTAVGSKLHSSAACGASSASKDPKLEFSVEAAADMDMQVVAVTESTPDVIKVAAPAQAADTSLPLQCKSQEDCKVSPLPLSSGNSAAGAGVNVGTAMHADAARNTSAQANSPTFKPKIQNKLSVRNHGGRPMGPQGTAQWLKKEPGPWKGSSSPGSIVSAAGNGMPLANSSRNNGNGKGKPWVNESSKNVNKFCYKCESEGHVTHKCRTPEHLVQLYLQDKKKKVGIHQICYRCGTRGHMARKCRTPQHLVDLYQNHRAAMKTASLETGVPQSNIN